MQGCTKKTFSNHGGVKLLKVIIYKGDPEHDGRSSNSLPWCICGHCRHMLLEVEEVCCRQRICITREEFFQSAVLDMGVLSIAMVNHNDVFVDDPEYTPSSYQKAATASGYCGSMDILVGPTEESYHLVWCGQSMTDTHRLMAYTLG